VASPSTSGAYQVDVSHAPVNNAPSRSLDTPGHEAFTAHGAARGTRSPTWPVAGWWPPMTRSPPRPSKRSKPRPAPPEVPIVVGDPTKIDKEGAQPRRGSARSSFPTSSSSLKNWGGDTVWCGERDQTARNIDKNCGDDPCMFRRVRRSPRQPRIGWPKAPF